MGRGRARAAGGGVSFARPFAEIVGIVPVSGMRDEAVLLRPAAIGDVQPDFVVHRFGGDPDCGFVDLYAVPGSDPEVFIMSRKPFYILLAVMGLCGAAVSMGTKDPRVSLDSAREIWADVLRDVDDF